MVTGEVRGISEAGNRVGFALARWRVVAYGDGGRFVGNACLIPSLVCKGTARGTVETVATFRRGHILRIHRLNPMRSYSQRITA